MLINLSNNFYEFIFLFLFSFKIIYCQKTEFYLNSPSICNKDNINSFSDKNCFNKYLMFQNYQVNHLAKNYYGDFIVEFVGYKENNEKSSSRIFYGLDEFGFTFFNNKSPYSKGFDLDINGQFYDDDFSLDDSKNLFVYIDSKNIYFV